MNDVLKAMMTTKQSKGERLAVYIRRLKTATHRVVQKSHIGGALISTKYVKGMMEYIDKDM